MYIETKFWGEEDTKSITLWSSANYQMELAHLWQMLVIAGRCIDLKAKGSDKIISYELLQDTGHRKTSP